MAVARSYKPSKCSGTPVRRTLAESAALPVLFVGSGSFLLAKKGAEEEEEAAAEGGEVDFYRDTPVRFAGYANEVGESFAPLVPAWIVPASYGVAIFYVVADTVDKVTKALNGDKYGPKDVTSCALIEGLDALIWQLAASVALPGYTIHQLVAVVIASMAALGVTPGESAVIDAIPTVLGAFDPATLGLATIPFIVKPLDELAEELMDVTLRKIWEPYLEECSVDYSR
ncbi:mitochondrial 18 KDa protein-domain-containing protein [Pelagophyceae sp. CCMP2097]|nr:mitochondrial 18 KDa protein-domain-containing protein [Pelagophyceae sp. CCMP2097]